jgi:tRNA (guanine-N7-)-methyltransferase
MLSANINSNKNIRSFGRINGRGVSKITPETLEEVVRPSLLKIDNYENINFNDIFGNNSENHLEIGFGYGESVFERAKKSPRINYVGSEVYTKGVVILASLIKKHELKNIKIFNGDARLLLEKIVDGNLDKVFLLFPDPWPKKKQNKRRIVDDAFLELLARKLKAGGEFFFCSDIDNYAEWVLDKVRETGRLRLLGESAVPPEWWVMTRYQEKAVKEGRKERFLSFGRG